MCGNVCCVCVEYYAGSYMEMCTRVTQIIMRVHIYSLPMCVHIASTLCLLDGIWMGGLGCVCIYYMSRISRYWDAFFSDSQINTRIIRIYNPPIHIRKDRYKENPIRGIEYVYGKTEILSFSYFMNQQTHILYMCTGFVLLLLLFSKDVMCICVEASKTHLK